MKKLFITLVTILSVSLTAMADGYDSCVVKNGNGASVVVSVEDFTKDGTVYVNIASDCDDYVNVTYTLTLREYNGMRTGNPVTGEQTFTYSVQPNSNTSKTHRISVSSAVVEVDVTVKGARCE